MMKATFLFDERHLVGQRHFSIFTAAFTLFDLTSTFLRQVVDEYVSVLALLSSRRETSFINFPASQNTR